MNNDSAVDIEELLQAARADPRSDAELVSQALAEPEEDAAWECVSILHRRGTRGVFEAAKLLCQSANTAEQCLGAKILGQLGVPNRSFPQESVALLLQLLATQPNEDVLEDVCFALGHIHDPTAIPAIARLSHHPHEYVRYAVAFALEGYDDPVAIDALIHLTTDVAVPVRDWAMFALGSMTEADTPNIRAALFRGCADPDDDVRGEALVGLARRHDDRVLEPLQRELAHATVVRGWCFALEAAEAIADPRLLPLLLQLKQKANASDEHFDEAIRLCSVVAE